MKPEIVIFNGHRKLASRTENQYGSQALMLCPGEHPGQLALIAPADAKNPERLFAFGTRNELLAMAASCARP